MKKREIYNYSTAKYAVLKQPMRLIMKAYGEAERYFAFIKEVTWAEWGLKHLTDRIHALEHIQPERVDDFKDIMAQVGLMVEYPPVNELAEDFANLDKVFEVCVGIVDNIDEALRFFIASTNKGEFEALARQVETLLVENSADRSFLLDAWSMWDNGVSYTSFDNWVKEAKEQDNG